MSKLQEFSPAQLANLQKAVETERVRRAAVKTAEDREMESKIANMSDMERSRFISECERERSEGSK